MEDAINIVYHPNSKRAEEIKSLYDYCHELKTSQPVEKEPWKPFQTRGDFEFAELVLAASLSDKQTNALIALVRRFVRGEETFTITSNTDLQGKWKQASLKLTDVRDSIPFLHHLILLDNKV